jgi:hypothetical protein
MTRLYSDLQDSASRRYYFGLNSAPGGITNAAPAALTLFGRTAIIQEQLSVFRTPTPATLTIAGLSLTSPALLIPAQAALSLAGQVPALATLQIITNAPTVDYTDLAENAPTAITIMTVAPGRALLTLNYPALNVTQGGNIGFLSPGVASLTLLPLAANLPREIGVAAMTVIGYPATLIGAGTINAGVGVLTIQASASVSSVPFTWVDDDRTPATAWLEDPPA